MSTASATGARVDRVVEGLRERELDSLLVTNLINLRYLTGFTGTNGAAVITPDERLFLTDFRYTEQAEEQVGGFERLPAARDLVGDLAERLRGRAGFDDADVSVRTHRRLEEKVGEGIKLVPAGGLIEDLREVKDPTELSAIAEAARLATEVLERVLERGLAGRTEREVALDIENGIRAAAGEDPSFDAIVASGGHGALPHASPRDVEIPAGELVVIDWGARLDGYCSDCTRTLASGDVGEGARDIYELVRRAQAATLTAVRPGAGVRDVDGVARAIIEEAGYGERFGHGAGHGVGLEVHEGPRLAKTAEGELRPGNVVTIEPGIYLPGELGVRIEDLVAVTDDGPAILSSFPKELTTV